MREKIVLRRRSVPVAVNLPNSTSFVSRYERISRKQLPGNISVSRTRTVGYRNKRKTKKKVRFALANTPTQDRAKEIIYIYIYIYINLRRTQTGKGPADNSANLGITVGSKAVNSVIGKKLIETNRQRD